MGFREVFLGAIGYVALYKRPLAKALLIPFLVYMLLHATSLLPPSWLLFTLVAVTTPLVHTIFAIITHRVILLGPGSVPEWGVMRWSLRETLFLIHFLGVGVVALAFALVDLVIALVDVVPYVSRLAILVLAGWTISRLSLVFPAIAINEGVTFRLSWKLTHDKQLLMFLVIVVLPLAILMPIVPLSLIPYSFVLTSFLSTLATVITVATLSVAYKVIRKDVYGS